MYIYFVLSCSVTEQKLNPSAVLDALKAYDKTIRCQNEQKYMGATNCSVEDLTAVDRKSADDRNAGDKKNADAESPTKSDDVVFVPDVHVEDTASGIESSRKDAEKEDDKTEAKDDDLPPSLPVKQKMYGQVIVPNSST